MGPPGTRHSRVFAFAQDGGLGIQGDFGQFGFFVFLLLIFHYLPLSRTVLSYSNTSNKLSLRGVSDRIRYDEAISQNPPYPPFLKGGEEALSHALASQSKSKSI